MGVTFIQSGRFSSGPVVSDTFDRADGAIGTADTGQSWVANSGTWTVATNQAKEAGGAQKTVVIDSGLADCTITCTMSVVGTEAGLCWRSTDDSNHFLFNNGANAFRKQGGGFTAVASAAALSNGDIITVTLSGDTHTIKKNGAAWMSFTSSFQNTATKHGLRGHNSSSLRWDDFSVSA